MVFQIVSITQSKVLHSIEVTWILTANRFLKTDTAHELKKSFSITNHSTFEFKCSTLPKIRDFLWDYVWLACKFGFVMPSSWPFFFLQFCNNQAMTIRSFSCNFKHPVACCYTFLYLQHRTASVGDFTLMISWDRN